MQNALEGRKLCCCLPGFPISYSYVPSRLATFIGCVLSFIPQPRNTLAKLRCFSPTRNGRHILPVYVILLQHTLVTE
jgi:hypothetical protein